MNMDDEENDVNKSIEDVILPGFRFHPTDEELVGFYLKKKIQHRTLPIELIKQVDIYKYDPWDLPRLASTGEKEMYFYCPRDRKYRNSARPNRVTGAGFWKATGTDRPIYSSEGNKCIIGLKKSLVFYRGRAAKGLKTDWMMHEFRLPSLSDPAPPKKVLDRNFPANDSWAICRIFKKTNSVAQRALFQSRFSISPETTSTDHMLNQGLPSTQFSPENLSCTSEAGSAALPLLCCNNTDFQQGSTTSFATTAHATSYKPSLFRDPSRDSPTNIMFSPFENIIPDGSKTSENIDFGGPQIQFDNISFGLPEDIQGNMAIRDQEVLELSRANGFPFALPSSTVPDPWRPNQTWDSPPGPSSEMSTSYPTNKC